MPILEMDINYDLTIFEVVRELQTDIALPSKIRICQTLNSPINSFLTSFRQIIECAYRKAHVVLLENQHKPTNFIKFHHAEP